MWYDRSVSLISLEAGSTSALSECRRMCDTERDFLCKSVSVQLRARSPLCLLSSDDSVSLNGANAANSLMPDRDFTYSERSACNNGNFIINGLGIKRMVFEHRHDLVTV